MFDYYKFADGTLINIHSVDSVRTYNTIVPVSYNEVIGESVHTLGSFSEMNNNIPSNNIGSALCSVFEIVENGHQLKLYNISKDDWDAFIEAIKKSADKIITKDTIKEI